MNIYIASKFDNRHSSLVHQIKAQLEAEGHVITASWLECRGRPDPSEECFHDFIRAWGIVDKRDLDQSDVLVLILENMEGSNGGCHWEAGYMYGLGRPVVVYSPEPLRSPFYTFPDVTVVSTGPSALVTAVGKLRR